MKYQQETIAWVLSEILPLLKINFSETETYVTCLNPNLELYAKLEELGMYHVFTARTDSGELVGYLGMITQPTLHNYSEQASTNDIFFVAPEHRGKFVGSRLLVLAEKTLMKQGVAVMFIHSKSNNDLDCLLIRHGYVDHEHVHAKRLGVPN